MAGTEHGGDSLPSKVSGLGEARMNPLRSGAIVAAIFAGDGAQALIFDVLPPILHQIALHFGGGRGRESMAQMASTSWSLAS